MKKVFQIAFISCISFACCCTGSQKEKIQTEKSEETKNMDEEIVIINDLNIKEKDSIIRYIEKMKRIIEESGVEFSEFYYGDEEDMDNGIILYSHWLNKKNYHFPSDEHFYKKLEAIFNIKKPCAVNIINHNKFFIYMTPRDWDTFDYKSLPEGSEWDRSYNNIFFIKNKNFIMHLSDLGLFAWIDNNNLYQTRFNENIFHYNNYIFNDNRADLAWLIQNDIEFLELLVKEFGYDKDEKLNKAVIRFVYDKFENPPVRVDPMSSQDESQAKNFFCRKNNEDKFIVHEGIMKTIVDMTTLEDVKYLDWLDTLGIMLSLEIREREKSDIFFSFNQEERLKLMAYICYYIETAYIKNNITGNTPEWNNRSRLSFGLIDIPQFLPFLEENNYFDLPGYEEMIRNRLQQYNDLWG